MLIFHFFEDSVLHCSGFIATNQEVCYVMLRRELIFEGGGGDNSQLFCTS